MNFSESRNPFVDRSRRCLCFLGWIMITALSLPAMAGLATSERITYQGRLLDNGTPFTGTVDMAFGLWTQSTGGTEVTSQTISGVEVANGLFQVELFFGEEAYEDSLWIEVVADGTTLTPRQPITAVPLALHALNGGGFWELISGTLSYDGPVAIETSSGEGLNVSGDSLGIRAESTGENGTALRAAGPFAVRADGSVVGVEAFGDVIGMIAQSPEIAVYGLAETVDGYSGYFTGEDGSSNYFKNKVGIGTLEPTAMLEIDGPGVGQPPAALRVSVNEDEKLVVGSLGMSILQNVFLDGALTLTTLATGGSIDLCRTGSVGFPGQVATCSSSARYKTDIASIDSATALVDELRPVTFRWTATGEADYGFVAEEVAEIEPRLATYNTEGEVEGVKYRQLSAVLLRALQEQRRDTERLQDEVRILSVELERSQEIEEQNRLLTRRLDRLEALLIGERSLADQE